MSVPMRQRARCMDRLRNLRFLGTFVGREGRHIGRLQPGQALVELTLSLTFVMMLLTAAADLGMAYKAKQTLINATAEAASYLDMNPALSCSTTGCDPLAAADAEALKRFRTEQGAVLHGSSSTLDLNANGIDDLTETGGATYVSTMFQVDEADNTQIDATPSDSFGVGSNFDPT